MAKVKGQNLRLFLGDDAIACALTCQLHASAEVQDTSTKDDDDEIWTENEVTKLNWDISTDALVTVTNVYESGDGYGASVVDPIVHGEFSCLRLEHPFNLKKGQSLVVSNPNTSAGAYLIITDAEADLLTGGNNSATWTAPVDMTVYAYIGIHSSPKVHYEVNDAITDAQTLEDLMSGMEEKATYLVKFSTASGREEEDILYYGYINITDISVNANNGEYAQYTLQAQGVGELHIQE